MARFKILMGTWLACIGCSVVGKTLESAAIDQLRKKHTQDLFEQKKVLETHYLERVERLTQERTALAEQLADERHVRCSLEECNRCFELKMREFEGEITKLKQQVDKKNVQEEKQWCNLYQSSIQECSALSAECEALRGELQLAMHDIHALKHAEQTYQRKYSELLARQQKMHEQQEAYQRVISVLATKDHELVGKEKLITELTGSLYNKNEQVTSLEYTIKELIATVEHERASRQQAKEYIKDLELRQADALRAKEQLTQELALLRHEKRGTGSSSQQTIIAKQPQEHFIADTQCVQNKV